MRSLHVQVLVNICLSISMLWLDDIPIISLSWPSVCSVRPQIRWTILPALKLPTTLGNAPKFDASIDFNGLFCWLRHVKSQHVQVLLEPSHSWLICVNFLGQHTHTHTCEYVCILMVSLSQASDRLVSRRTPSSRRSSRSNVRPRACWRRQPHRRSRKEVFPGLKMWC